jgi:catechol 2,3-dioxygenase-like lactoylglutathione lyase family enzyme
MDTVFILYVKNQEESCRLYSQVLAIEPCLNVPGMTEFVLSENAKLGIMPENGIQKILKDKTKEVASGNGIPRAEIYLYVNNIESYYNRAINAGLREISKIEKRNWGDTTCYFSDNDGHIIAFATKE